MWTDESRVWMERASEHRDSRTAMCHWAGSHLRDPGLFERAMLAYGLAYCLDVADGSLDPSSAYAFGWAVSAHRRFLTRTRPLEIHSNGNGVTVVNVWRDGHLLHGWAYV